jgi:hypothetical protein
MAKKAKDRKPAAKSAKPSPKPKAPPARQAAPPKPVPKSKPVPRAKAPAPKPAAKRPPARTPKPAAAPRTQAPPAAKGKEALAARMAAFSQKVQEEEEAPVAVRSWSEAKAEKPASKQLLPKTGEVTPAEDEDESEETETEEPESSEQGGEGTDEEPSDDSDEEAPAEEPPRPTGKPQMNPLTGPLAVPKDRELEFEVAPRHKIKKAGKGGERPEEFGPVELRQATASGGRHITRALPENLQRGAERIQPLATGTEKGGAKKKAGPERFEVSMDKRAGPRLPDISTWGDVEIGQQTLSGSRKVGMLSPEEEAERRRAEEERKRAKK